MQKIVFDGDDTLWSVEWLYSQAYADFFSYLYEVFGCYTPNIHFIYKVFFANEDKNAKTMGIRRGRVAQSMADTYTQLCEWIAGRTGDKLYHQAVEETVRKIGDQPFDIKKHLWVPGAQETLHALVEKGNTLCLLTKYERTLWPQKAALLGTSRFFENGNIRIVDTRKTLEDFLEVSRASDHAGDRLFTVGNSEGDMLPVIHDSRWHGFYVPQSSSFMLEKDRMPDSTSFEPKPYRHDRVTTLASIRDLAAYF
ncbi:MAG: hypothetical protein Q8Q39_00325 [bacterium]|nr:hypothetical protein [bacterium]